VVAAPHWNIPRSVLAETRLKSGNGAAAVTVFFFEKQRIGGVVAVRLIHDNVRPESALKWLNLCDLGDTQAQTTQRYAHLVADPVAETVGVRLTPKPAERIEAAIELDLPNHSLVTEKLHSENQISMFSDCSARLELRGRVLPCLDQSASSANPSW
jgi:hypothetical protein